MTKNPNPNSMARRKKKKNEKKGRVNKLVYLRIESVCWMKIDPHYKGEGNGDGDGCCIDVKEVNEMKFPAEFDDLQQVLFGSYSYCEAKSKVYLTGGLIVLSYDDCENDFDNHKFYGYKYSNKMYSYDLISAKWDGAPPLNVPRAYHSMVPIGNLIYVFGCMYHGLGDTNFPMDYLFKGRRERWIEVYNLDHAHPRWEFLPISSAPPPDIFFSDSINQHVVYELGNQILFFIQDNSRSAIAVYSFSYVTQTWESFDERINWESQEPFVHSLLRCNMDGGVTIVGHVLCWEYFGTVYGYHLRARHLIFEHRMNQEFDLAIELAEKPDCDFEFSAQAFLVCVGKNTFLFIMWQHYGRHSKYYIYRFRIHKKSDGDGCCLAFDGFKSLGMPGVAAKPLVITSCSLSSSSS